MWRAGRHLEVSVTLRVPRPLVAAHSHDVRPDYYIYAGGFIYLGGGVTFGGGGVPWGEWGGLWGPDYYIYAGGFNWEGLADKGGWAERGACQAAGVGARGGLVPCSFSQRNQDASAAVSLWLYVMRGGSANCNSFSAIKGLTFRRSFPRHAQASSSRPSAPPTSRASTALVSCGALCLSPLFLRLPCRIRAWFQFQE